MKKIISIAFLSSQEILEKYFFKEFENKEIKKYLFLQLRHGDIYKPDYIFKNAIESFVEKENINFVLKNALENLSSMLMLKNSKIYVENNCFEEWQNTILSISPMLLISYSIFKHSQKSLYLKSFELIETILDKTALPSIYQPEINFLIKNEGLNETHMHLNGATEIDIVWQDALLQTQKFYLYCKKTFDNVDVSEQYLQKGKFEQKDLYLLLKLASQIRDELLCIIYNKKSNKEIIFNKNNFDIDKILRYVSKKHPICRLERNLNFKNSMQYEAFFFIKCFEYLFSKKNIYATKLFYYYILIYSYFQKLLVQQKTQVGFDQFQKITFNELRELTEEKYDSRYSQIQGMYGDSLSVLEGRFAPKDNLGKSLKLLKNITKGYEKNHKDKFDLKLIPHFIKIKDSRKIEEIITFRDLKLRLKNKRSLLVLLETMKYRNKEKKYIFKELIRGFDVAANELHASPEVFSPVFRKLNYLGYGNFTYHVGEDFIHILSGLRAIYEAVDFLDMKTGNRIGHGTAMGIEPELWNRRLLGCKLTIKKGEWLDNLVFSYYLCVENGIMMDLLNKMETEIRKYFCQIYDGSNYYPIGQIIEAWKCRKYDPFIVFRWREPSLFEDFEKKELEEYLKINKITKCLYGKYHSKESIEKYNELIQIEPFEILDAKELRELQNIMIQLLNKKDIAVETPLSSNVRISYYKEYKEHHLSRWLGLTREEDPKPKVVIGSDDTGIFMTNLKNEYLHIYQMLCRKVGSEEAFKKIIYLNNMSKAYTFY